MNVGAERCLNRWAAFWNRLAFLTPIQPLLSHSFRCFVRPWMMYFESVLIIRGQKVGISVAALIMAASSPTWFDWSVPGICKDVLRGCTGLIQMPLPHITFSFPLLKQALSVYTVIDWSGRVSPGACLLLTGALDNLVGLVNIRKHSAKSVLHAISVSNIVLSLFSFAALL